MDSKKFSTLTFNDFHMGDRVKHYSYATGTVINKVNGYFGGKILIRWDKPYRGKNTSWAYPTSLKLINDSTSVANEDFDEKNSLADKNFGELMSQYLQEFEDALKEESDKNTNVLDDAIDKIYVDEKAGTVIVSFVDGVKEVVHKQPQDNFDINVGVALAVAKYIAGSNTNFHKTIATKVVKINTTTNTHVTFNSALTTPWADEIKKTKTKKPATKRK